MVNGQIKMNSFLYNKLFRNKLFDIGQELQTAHQLFQKLTGDKTLLLDRYIIVDNQISAVRRELDILIGYLGKIDSDFRE